jgi:alpha-1,3-glucosyltransferase
MSQAAAYVDPAMLVVKNLGYDSWQTVYFQRTTVILTELVLVYALSRYGIYFYRTSAMKNILKMV